jgi:hypothetical protein
MDRNIELYIKAGIDTDTYTFPYERLELFDFEDVNLTEKIADIKDISKVFTTFSREFTVPSSKNNNKVFKHYYNFQIQNSFDARFKVGAMIKLDGADYKTGKVSLMGVTMRDGSPINYRIVFYGETVSLKDILGDDELNDLRYKAGSSTDKVEVLEDMEFNYTDIFVRNSLTNGKYLEPINNQLTNASSISQVDLCFPFISSQNYYFYDSNVGSASPSNGNTGSRNVIDSNDSDTTPRGISYLDLKPALRVERIIQAIEQRYDIGFKRDKFFSSSNLPYSRLFLWLNREKGNIKGQLAEDVKSYSIGDFSPTGLPNWNGGDSFTVTSTIAYHLSITITPLLINDTYTLKVTSDAGADFTANSVGTDTFLLRYEPQSILVSGTGTVTPNIEVSTLGNMSAFDINIELQQMSEDIDGDFNVVDNDYNFVTKTNQTFTANDGVVNLSTQMPKMKIIDFLTSLFKMFNLTAYYENGEIQVQTLDSYYSSGAEYDITHILDTSKGSINRSKLYSEVNMEFSEPKTFAITKANEITGDEFGNEKLNNVFKNRNLRDVVAFDGGKYDVRPKFERMMFERMSSQGSNILTDIQWGWSANEDEDAVLTKPVLFYPELQTPSIAPTSIGFDTSDEDNFLVSKLESITTYIKPTNVLVDTLQSIHFGSEFNEWDGTEITKSLVNEYYLNYILTIYDKSARIFKLSAYLPSYLISKLKLNDTLIIDGSKYRINEMDINLNKGGVKLELFNDLGYYD